MSVIIKEMEMPIDCLACRVSCNKESYNVVGRPPKCPLTEASDLISRADAIEAVMAEGRKVYTSEYASAERVIYEADAVEALSMLPSADAEVYEDYEHATLVDIKAPLRESAEAVHGVWIDIDNYYRLATCSHCHKVTMFEKWGEYTKPYNYCPNCGAKMKGGDAE